MWGLKDEREWRMKRETMSFKDFERKKLYLKLPTGGVAYGTPK